MIVIDRKAPWQLELAWLGALLAELGHERAFFIAAITREYLHSMIDEISDEQETSMMVERQASRTVELAISVVLLVGANRELDSSIIIKKTSIHLAAHASTTRKKGRKEGTERSSSNPQSQIHTQRETIHTATTTTTTTTTTTRDAHTPRQGQRSNNERDDDQSTKEQTRTATNQRRSSWHVRSGAPSRSQPPHR